MVFTVPNYGSLHVGTRKLYLGEMDCLMALISTSKDRLRTSFNCFFGVDLVTSPLVNPPIDDIYSLSYCIIYSFSFILIVSAT